jgi:isopenicillin N synthase-like dioxygenase
MDKWGYKLHDAVIQVAEMAAIGMGLEKDNFTEKLSGGAHLLAPTGSDLEKNDIGAIFAGFHYDIAFLTIHGKSRYPGLYVWLRNNQKLQVKVPNGCLLLQAGKTFEHITGGYVLAGLHEVIYTDKTKEHFEIAKSEGRPTWRVSSTMFTHFRYNVDCSPMPELKNLYKSYMEENVKEFSDKYPKMSSFDILMTELNATNMVEEGSEYSNSPAKGEQMDI